MSVFNFSVQYSAVFSCSMSVFNFSVQYSAVFNCSMSVFNFSVQYSAVFNCSTLESRHPENLYDYVQWCIGTIVY